MTKKDNERIFLLLKDDAISRKAKEILKSPLKLAEDLITKFVEKKLDDLKENLDSIKQFAAGIKAAEDKSSYTLAKFYPFYFAFHQFVQSSFRARQGKVLEEIFKVLFKEDTYNNIKVLEKKELKKILDLENNESQIPDFDLALNVKNQFLVFVQIRSRDDTGGTTAKASLMEGLKFLIKKSKTNLPIYYVVFVWEPLDSSQKKVTLNKFYNYLSEIVNISPQKFSVEILSEKGLKIKKNNKNFVIKLVYGLDEFITFIGNLLQLDSNWISELNQLLELISNWDDLWVAYSVIGKEYERYKEKNESFIFEIIDFLKRRKFKLKYNSYENIKNYADLIASEFIKECNKPSPFEKPKDNFLYFRDIVFLLFIYHKKKEFLNDSLIIPTFIKFRELYSEFTTNYATHKIYYYPASFIPHTVRYCIENFSKKGDVVLDIFAGGGTVGLESFILDRNSILIDINPLLPEIIKIKTCLKDLNPLKIEEEIIELLNEGDYVYIPSWKNIHYWYPKEILNFLSKLWGNLYNKNFEYKLLYKFALLYISKKFSYADDNIPKLYASRLKRKKINSLLQNDNWKLIIKDQFKKRIKFLVEAILELKKIVNYKKRTPYCKVFVEDAFNFDIENIQTSVDLIITSPPYLQAQEYIRSIKLDLFWSGFDENYVREISKLEIPYRKFDISKRINSYILNKLRSKLNLLTLDKKKQELFEGYFFYTIKSLEKYLPLLKKDGFLCIFVGNPKFNGVEISIWEILLDYFSRELKFIDILADPILNRKLGYKRKNSNPNGISYEYLLIFQKK